MRIRVPSGNTSRSFGGSDIGRAFNRTLAYESSYPRSICCFCLFAQISSSFIVRLTNPWHSFRLRMDNPSPQTDQQDSLCQKCQEPGNAMCIVRGRGIRTIHYYCFTCRHEWMRVRVVARDPFPFLRLITSD